MDYESREWLEKMDLYREGRLTDAQKEELETIMNDDPEFRKWADQHLEFLELMSSYGQRSELAGRLDKIHEEVAGEIEVSRDGNNGRKLWPILAIAASVAAVSVIGTLLIVRSFDIKHDAVYKELRRNVEQIKKSQRQILADITANKEKANSNQYSGTGFVLSPNGYIVTNYHVVKGADSIIVENAKFGSMKTSILKVDEQSDIAILMVIDSTFSAGRLPYKLRDTEAEIGEGVYTLGFPKEDIVYGEGAISSSTGYRQDEKAYQVSVPVNPGNSGGPLLDAQGNLTGIIAGVQTETAGATFAVKSRVLLDLINQIQTDSTVTLKRPISYPNSGRLYKADRVQQVKMWKDYILMVRVYNAR